MSLPKISIITPSFNQGKFLEETIQSVISQDYPNLEYIVIDGGSADNSVEVIKKYESHLHFWTSEKDRGQSHAINKGFQKASGEIISWLNSDDLYLKDALVNAAGVFKKNPEAALIHGKTILFGNKKKETEKGAEDFDLQLRYFSMMPYAQPSSFFRRKVLDEQGLLDETLHFGMDYDLLIRIALNYKIEKTELLFSKYRLHEESKTMSQLEDFAVDWAKIFSKFLRTIDKEKKWIKLLESINFYREGNDTYRASRVFEEKEMKIIFLYFLEYQLHIYYDMLDFPVANKIIMLMKDIDKSFFKERNLGAIDRRVKNLNPFIVRFLRKISR